TEFVTAGGNATDNCGIDETTFTLTDEQITGNCPIIVTRTYQIADSCGNTDECTQTFTIHDITPPEITCPPDSTLECFVDLPLSYTNWTEFVTAGGSATDNCGIDETTFTLTDEQITGNCPTIVTRTYQVADSCGNTDECTQTFTIHDLTPPEITCPPDSTLECFVDLPSSYTNWTEFVTAGGNATDNCGIDETTFTLTDEQITGNCPIIVTRTYQVADSCGNTDECTQTFTIHDLTPPEITCPPDSTLECFVDLPSSYTNWTEFVTAGGSATDNCGIDETTFTLTDDQITGNCPTIVTRTYQIADSCGNTDECTQTFTIHDLTPPEITCPPDSTLECFVDLPSFYVNWTEFVTAGGSATDNCGIDETTFTLTDEQITGNCPTIVTRTYQVADSCENIDECTQTFIVNDTIPPEITCSSDVAVECYIDVPIVYTDYSEFTTAGGSANDNCGIVDTSFALQSETQDGECPRIITRIYEISDSCNNTSTCTQIITVHDITPPTIICPPNDTIEKMSDLPPRYHTLPEFIAAGGQADDNCGIEEFNYLGQSVTGHCPRIIRRTYEVIDSCGNFAQCEHEIIHDDTIAPQMICPPDTLVECYEDIPDPLLTIEEFEAAGGIVEDNNGIEEFEFIGQTVYGTCPRVIQRTYFAKDSCNNTTTCIHTITQEDTTAPVISCPDTLNFECLADVIVPYDSLTEFETAGGMASDNCSLETFMLLGEVITGECPTIITRTYQIADSCDNTAECQHIIMVNDVTPPTITCPGDTTVECFIDVPIPYADLSLFLLAGGTANDNCGVELFAFVSETHYGNCPTIITRTYQVSDSCGNIAECEQSIYVNDTTPPEIYCPDDINAYVTEDSCETFVNIPLPMFTDNCGVDSVYNSQTGELNASTIYQVGTTTVTWYAVDSCGNMDSCSMSVFVQDTINPIIDCPDDTTAFASADSCSANLILPPPAYSDNCGVDSVWNSYTGTGNASGVYNEGVTEIWWYVVDDYGNIDSCLMLVTVIDTIPPQITCPPDESVYAGLDSCSAYVFVGQPVTSDNCGVDSVWNSYTGTDDASAVYDVGIENVWWYALDIYGNIDSCEMFVTVEDIQPPYVYCPNDTIGYANDTSCAGWVDVLPATALDNCEVDSVWNDYNLTGNASDIYEVGDTDVWWYAVDIYGNIDSCMMSVTVEDTIAPVITCPNDTIVYAMADSCWADVVLDPATATDNCEVDNIWNDYNGSGNASDLYPVGVTDIWWYAVDIYGNIDSCMMSVEVIDTIPPQITCPADIIVVAGLDSCEAFVSVPLPAVDDNCEVDSSWNNYNQSINASDVYEVGVTNVWWYVVDVYGNLDSCMMTITVNDEQSPIISCPSDITGYANDSACEGYVAIPPATATD
ncbi:MAG: HYR domain-containing protein, partial [Bacteroidales bacterium]|nr:HYR domain-containing protein [Bacteroidales bacterium]